MPINLVTVLDLIVFGVDDCAINTETQLTKEQSCSTTSTAAELLAAC